MTERAAPDWLTRWEFAHRGLHDGEKLIENSLGAAKAAIAAGMGIECDIQMSRDGVPMVFHDWELTRLTNGKGLTAAHDGAKLEALILSDTEDRPIRLARLLSVVGDAVPILIEIKSLPDYDVLASCRAVAGNLAGFGGRYAVMSFDPRVPAWFAEHEPHMARGLVCTDTLDHGWIGKWREAGVIEGCRPHFLACDIRDLPNDLASEWRSSGRPLLTWTVRSPELRMRALEHANALISEGDGLP